MMGAYHTKRLDRIFNRIKLRIPSIEGRGRLGGHLGVHVRYLPRAVRVTGQSR